MKNTNHQFMTKVFQYLRKKLGITTGYSTFWMEAMKTNVLVWGLFMSYSMKAAIHLGPIHLANSEIYKNTKFEDIESVLNITQKLAKEHSEEILNVNTIESASPSWKRSVLSHDQVIQWTSAKVRVFSDSVKCLGKMNASKDAITRWEGQVEEFKMSPSYKALLGIDGEAIEFEWNIFLRFSSLQILHETQNDLRERNIEPEKFTDRIIFMSVFNDIDWTRKRKRCNLYVEFRKSQGMREKIHAWTLDVSRSWRRKEVVWNSPFYTWRKMGFYSHSNGGTIQRYWSSSIQEYQCFESCNRKITETLQCGCFIHRALVPNRSFCKTAQYSRSSFELVWTSKTFGIFSQTSIWKQFVGKTSGLRITVRDNSIHKGLRTRIVLAKGISWYELQN